MSPKQKILYGKIARFQIDQPNVICPFSVKLAWQYRWSGVFTHRAIREYKKFIFLVMVSDQRLSPTTIIDRVWHQHILYTQSYWNEFCGQLLGRQIHHTPGLGGKTEALKYYRQCDYTLGLYQKYFGTPPADIWSPPQLQVESLDYQWVNLAHHWVIPQTQWLAKIKRAKIKLSAESLRSATHKILTGQPFTKALPNSQKTR